MYNGILFSLKIEKFTYNKWMKLEDIILIQISQAQKGKYCVISLTCRIYKVKVDMVMHTCNSSTLDWGRTILSSRLAWAKT
jgi:hypothetical protein